MGRHNPPTSDTLLPGWVSNFSEVISESPEDLGLTTAIAAELAGKVQLYLQRLAESQSPLTRGMRTITLKQEARADLLEYCRAVARMVQGNMNVTDIQRQDLGLTVRKPPTRHGKPTVKPDLDRVSTDGNTVRFRIHNNSSISRRAKPYATLGAALYSYEGTSPPVDYKSWRFQGNATRSYATITFDPATQPGTRVWITACWFNQQGEGPLADPLETNLQGSNLLQEGQQQGLSQAGGEELAA